MQTKGEQCAYCRNGFFDPKSGGFYFGEDVECVNGILIDIDEAHEGFYADTDYPVAPCHPCWAKQKAGKPFQNDSYERLSAWSSLGAEPDEGFPS